MKNNTIYPHQYGFQKGNSTSLAIMDLQNKIINAIEEKKPSVSIFLDFAKAFDTVNHKILLSKLEYYGIRGVQLNWFKSYLTERPEKVESGGTFSKEQLIQCGVPQGSILGPLLFIIYINDIQNCSNILQFILFADDTSVFHSHADENTLIAEINKELKHVSDWLIANKLSLNISKSNFIRFGKKTKFYK